LIRTRRTKIFVFDVETLSKKSNAVILSMAAVHFGNNTPDPDVMREDAFFAKFNVEDQVRRLHRHMGKSTMEWWAKQCDNVKKASFTPSDQDVIFEDGYEAMRKWVDSKGEKNTWVFARGNLDQLVLDDIEEQCGLKPVWPFNLWRDVRTAVDLLHGSTNGYVDVDYPGFNSKLHITKHNPIDDCLLDAMMICYPRKE
jgi:hypothetical protein